MSTREILLNMHQKAVVYDIRHLDVWTELDRQTPSGSSIKHLTEKGVEDSKKVLLEDVDALHQLKYSNTES